MANEIYIKTTTEGDEKSLVFDPQYAYQVPFEFGQDWTDVKIGFLYNFVGLADGNAELPAMDAQESHAAGDSFVGIVKTQTPDFVPLTTGGGVFVGKRYDRILDISQNSISPYYAALVFGSPDVLNSVYLSSNAGTIISSMQAHDDESHYAGYNATATSNFCFYMGLQFTLIDKGLASQSILVRGYGPVGGMDARSAATSTVGDSSITSLRNLMNADFLYHTHTLALHDGVAALPVPDAMFWYNGFGTARPRIHAAEIQKLA